MHFRYFCYGVHSPDLFLPWHRWYLSAMEEQLRQIDCRVTIPYWDWSFVSHAWKVSKLWSKDGLGVFLCVCLKNTVKFVCWKLKYFLS